MVAVAPGEVFNFLALSAFPNEGPILTAWRPGAGVQGTEPLEPAMVVTRREQGTVTIGPLGKPADLASMVSFTVQAVFSRYARNPTAGPPKVT